MRITDCLPVDFYIENNGEMREIFRVAAAIFAILFADEATGQSLPGPHLVIYKAKKSYRNSVPVILSADKRSIISYPDPHDLAVNGKNATPVYLGKGYYLDNRGIDTNTAFLSASYSDYAKLKTPPSIDEMQGMIRDRRPIDFMCDCGLRASYADPVAAAKKLVKDKQLEKKCTVMKRCK